MQEVWEKPITAPLARVLREQAEKSRRLAAVWRMGKMKTKIELDIEVPMVPNFLFDMDSQKKYALSYFSEEILIEIAERWKLRLLERAAQMRSLGENDKT